MSVRVILFIVGKIQILFYVNIGVKSLILEISAWQKFLSSSSIDPFFWFSNYSLNNIDTKKFAFYL